MRDEPLEVQGHPPDLAGKTCQALMCLEYWHEGSLVEPASVVFIQADERWHELFFDCGIVHWRADVPPASSFDAPEIAARFNAIDLGSKLRLTGKRIAGCQAVPILRGAKVTIAFEDGSSIAFYDVDDITSYVAA